MIQEAIAAALEPIAPGRVFPVYIPIDVAGNLDELAAIVYQVLESSDDETICGPGIARRRMQVDIVAPGYSAAWAMQAAAQAALAGVTGVEFENSGYDDVWEFESRSFRVVMLIRAS